MSSIVVTGWNPGFDKIGMNKLLREQLGYSLGDAKRAVDDILENKPILLTIPAESVGKLPVELVRLGVVFETNRQG